jgi:hypothetical protein
LTIDDQLERRFRTLLRCYPARHRERHQDEMLGVLLADARPGQRWPGPAESASLVAGGLRVRLRTWSPGSAQSWRDALAVASVILPVLFATVAVVSFGLTQWSRAWPGDLLSPTLLTMAAEGPLPPLLMAVVVLVAGRRTALATVALLAAADIAFLVTHWGYPWVGPGEAQGLALLAVEAVSLAASAGPVAGRAGLRGRHYLLTIAAGAVLAAATTIGWWLRRTQPSVVYPYLSPLQQELVLAAVVTILAVALLARSGASRRLLAVLALPGYYFVVTQVMPTLGPLRNTLTIVPAALLVLAAAVILARRGGRDRRSASAS